MRRIDALTLRGWIEDGEELAILDAREEGEFGAAHLFWAVPCPLSRCEARVAAVLPRLATRIVCVDAGQGGAAGGLAERLGDYLEGIGCTDVAVLDGGTRAWAAAGYVLFSGVNVPSKAFGEWVEHHYGTVSVDAPELNAWIESGRDMVVLDSRTLEEFRRMSIPSGISVPGGELAYRIAELAPRPETLVVVNCAGRTRSIMGAESLRQAGIPNQVVALRNGTMGWELAGLTCARGREERYPAGAPASAALALARARAFAERSGVRSIDAAGLDRLAADASRTLYVLDVRDPAEFAADHLAGSISAPGGQLVQATDQWIGVRGARIALIDDDGARARMAGAWLRQMGHRDVFVVEGGLAARPVPARRPPVPPVIVLPADLLAAAPDALVVDLARSIEYREGHIPGAVWAIRSRLAAIADRLAGAPMVVLTSPDGTLAAFAVAEAQGLTRAPVRVLEGGTAGWKLAGHALVRDRTTPPDEACVDFYLRPYDRNSGVEAAMRAYLSWEIDLVHDIARDGTVRFGPSGHVGAAG
ncbi:MAG: thiosulfate sulfurtransferase [Rhodospirillales bacterium]|nr:thiosulfate sulfurtransferase [Rhodospirillales bacterium]MDE2199501.1 thiosulfate sulfurtransferase [Rhodospirillales bacterium]MDE2575785.1 thiosulfate sulfurtransferase [Rhodospirillales bacterium]